MKERLQHLLSEAGESFDYLRSDIRNLSRYLAELEELLERYRMFAANATLSTQTDRAERRSLLKKTQKVIGPPPDKQKDTPGTDAKAREQAEPFKRTQVEAQVITLLPCEH